MMLLYIIHYNKYEKGKQEKREEKIMGEYEMVFHYDNQDDKYSYIIGKGSTSEIYSIIEDKVNEMYDNDEELPYEVELLFGTSSEAINRADIFVENDEIILDWKHNN